MTYICHIVYYMNVNWHPLHTYDCLVTIASNILLSSIVMWWNAITKCNKIFSRQGQIIAWFSVYVKWLIHIDGSNEMKYAMLRLSFLHFVCWQPIGGVLILCYIWSLNNATFNQHYLFQMHNMSYVLKLKLTHLPLVPHICVSQSGKHWFS